MIFTLKLCFDLYASLIFSVLFGTDIKSNFFIVLFKPFPAFWVWWKVYFFPIILINERSNFGYSFRIFFSMFWWFNATAKAYWKQLSTLFFGLLLLFYFSTIQENLYISASFQTSFLKVMNSINQYYHEQITSCHWFF